MTEIMSRDYSSSSLSARVDVDKKKTKNLVKGSRRMSLSIEMTCVSNEVAETRWQALIEM